MALKLLHEPETDDPILSVVNLIDIFLVVIAALLITVAQSPLMSSIGRRDVTVSGDVVARTDGAPARVRRGPSQQPSRARRQPAQHSAL